MDKYMILVFAWLIAFPGATPAGEKEMQPEFTNEQLARIDNAWIILFQSGHFVLAGSVSDTDGTALEKFSVECPRSKSLEEMRKIKAARDKGDDEELGKLYKVMYGKPNIIPGISGKFQVDVQNAELYSFPLRFFANGYYDTKAYLEMPVDRKEFESINQAIVSGTIPKEVLVKKNLKVVMRKKPKETTKLQRWYVDLKLTNKGDQSLRQWAPPTIWAPPILKYQYGLPDHFPTKEEKVPPRSISLTAESNDDGSFRVLKTGPYGTFVVPRGVKIVVKGAPGDGLIRYQPKLGETTDKSIHYVPEPVLRGMGLAPEKGYQPEISLSTDELSGFADGRNDGPMFYVKLGGRYGRAQYCGFSFNESMSELSLRLDVELQPDGSRNLETGE